MQSRITPDPAEPGNRPNGAGEKLKSLFDGLMARPLEGGLYLVSTPIGNLGDMPPRALAVLALADAVYCEDTRHSRKLFAAFGIERQTFAYHDHTAGRERERIGQRLLAGQSVALISDAGTPLISDPGFKLVRDACAHGIRVIPIPGPTAAIAALTMSGLASDSFFFGGFLPPKAEARRKRLAETAGIPGTLIFYETPNRLVSALEDMAAIFAGRAVTVAREITKMHETALHGRFPEFAAQDFSAHSKGELVILVGPDENIAEFTDEQIQERLIPLLNHSSLRDAVDEVVNVLGVQRKRVYAIAQSLKDDKLSQL